MSAGAEDALLPAGAACRLSLAAAVVACRAAATARTRATARGRRGGADVVVRRIVVMGVVVLMMGIVIVMVVMVSVQIQHRHRHTVVVVVRHNRVGQQKDIGQQQEYYGHRAFHLSLITERGE